MSGAGVITSIAEIRQRLEAGPAHRFDQRPGDLEATRNVVMAPCCAVAKRDGADWAVLLMVGAEQLLLTPDKAMGLALDLVTAAELATKGYPA